MWPEIAPSPIQLLVGLQSARFGALGGSLTRLQACHQANVRRSYRLEPNAGMLLVLEMPSHMRLKTGPRTQNPASGRNPDLQSDHPRTMAHVN